MKNLVISYFVEIETTTWKLSDVGCTLSFPESFEIAHLDILHCRAHHGPYYSLCETTQITSA